MSGAVVGVEVTVAVAVAVARAVAVAGGTTTRLRHSPWLPDVSTAETWIETLAVR
jgi:hypothetical protein